MTTLLSPVRHSLTITFLPALALAGFIVVGLSAQRGPEPEVKARLDAFVNAVTSGDADKYEAMARDNFTPEFFKARTPEQRRQFVERLRGDFGTLTVGRVRTEDGEEFSLFVTGSTGMKGEIRLRLEPAAPRRIAGISVEAGTQGDEEAGAPPPPPISKDMNAGELAKALDAYVGPMADAGSFAGTVLVARDGSPIYQRAWGEANRDSHTAIATTTRFNLGSINKIFTRTAIAQLIAAGRLSLADTIGKLLPDYPNAQAKPATVDQLLEHRAGIADFFGPAFDAADKSTFRSNADYFRFVAPQALLFEPGTRRQYCNGCYIVLGAIIERLSGMRYEDYVGLHVFKPAGIAFTEAGFYPFATDTAMGYTRRKPGGGDGPLHANLAMHGNAGSAAGGAYASAANLLAFDNALREHRLLDAKMTAWVLGGDEVVAGRARGGLGIAGGAPGVNAVLESDGTWTVVVLANLDPPIAERLGGAIRRQLAR